MAGSPTFADLTALRYDAGQRLALRTWRHPIGTNSLRSLEPTPCGRGCLPLHCKAAPHLRYITAERLPGAHAHDTRPAASATTYRHSDTSPSPHPKRGASAHNSAPAPVAVWYVRPSGHFARLRELLRSTAHYCIDSLMTALSALFSVAPPPIPALLPRPPPLHATPTHTALATTSTRRASPICK